MVLDKGDEYQSLLPRYLVQILCQIFCPLSPEAEGYPSLPGLTTLGNADDGGKML